MELNGNLNVFGKVTIGDISLTGTSINHLGYDSNGDVIAITGTTSGQFLPLTGGTMLPDNSTTRIQKVGGKLELIEMNEGSSIAITENGIDVLSNNGNVKINSVDNVVIGGGNLHLNTSNMFVPGNFKIGLPTSGTTVSNIQFGNFSNITIDTNEGAIQCKSSVISIERTGESALMLTDDYWYGGERGIMTQEDEMIAVKFGNGYEFGRSLAGANGGITVDSLGRTIIRKTLNITQVPTTGTAVSNLAIDASGNVMVSPTPASTNLWSAGTGNNSVVGGLINTASGYTSMAIGKGNKATGAASFAGGYIGSTGNNSDNNIVTGAASFCFQLGGVNIPMGITSGVYSNFSAILGGTRNIINGTSATNSGIIGGSNHVINTSANGSVILGGTNIVANLSNSVHVQAVTFKNQNTKKMGKS